jgi:protein-tyrosine phosphatase
MSEEKLLPERESRLKEIREIGLTDDFAGCPKDWIEMMERHLGERYGGVEGYCEGVGVGEGERRRLKKLLLV